MKVQSTSLCAVLGAAALLLPIDAVQGGREGWKPGQRAVVKKASSLGSEGWQPGLRIGVDPVALDGSDEGVAEGDSEWILPQSHGAPGGKRRFQGGFVERLTKQILVDIFRRDLEEVEASFAAQKAPFSTLHPRIQELHHSRERSVEEQLGLPIVSTYQQQGSEAAAAGEEGEDQEWQDVNDFMASALGSSSSSSSGTAGEGGSSFSFGQGKGPWVTLVTSSGSSDKTSAQVNESFNRTLGLLYPDEIPKGGAAEASSIVDASSDSEEPFEDSLDGVGSVQEGAEVEDPVREAKIRELIQRARHHLKDWRWGVASFENEASLSWHWQIWKIPVIFIITPSTSPSRTYDIRHWPVAWVQPSSEQILAVLTPPKTLEEGGEGGEAIWRRFKLWDSSFAPGGSNAQLSDRLAGGFEYVYKVTDRVPTWGLTFVSGALATSIIGLMHRR